MVGAKPSYTKGHVLKTLLLLQDKRTGRKKLVKELGIGEGSVRTIIKKLKDEGLISSVKQGHTLTGKGKEYLDEVLKKFTKPVKFESYDLACGSPKSMAIIHDASAKITKGVNERDTAIKAGADGAVILVHKGGHIGFPSGEWGLEELPETKSKIDKLNLAEGDVVVISFGKNAISAEDGVLAVITDIAELSLP